MVRGEAPAMKLNPDVQQWEPFNISLCLKLESPSNSLGSRVSPLSLSKCALERRCRCCPREEQGQRPAGDAPAAPGSLGKAAT